MSYINISDLENEDLASEDGIQRICQQITEKENQLADHLNSLLGRQSHLQSKLQSISSSLSGLQLVDNDSKKLQDVILHTASIAENVSAKVRRLDEARNRVSECQQRVHDLIDLQLCSEGVKAALKNEDYEKGAAHVYRFLSMDQGLLQRTANDVAESVTSVSLAFSTLGEASTQIRSVITHKFDEAVKADDLASVERFFKIFPLLGMHDEGLHKFSLYLCSQIQEIALNALKNAMSTSTSDKRYSVLFADSLMTLFESIARIIETQSPLVETYYGPGRLIQVVAILQKECDRQAKKIVNEFIKHRNINRRTTQINDYMKGTTHGSSRGHGSASSSLDKLNPKDLDTLIGEVTIMHSRAELYVRFIRRRITSDIEVGITDEEMRSKKIVELEDLIKNSELSRSMQELLFTYLLLERYFMEETVLKAINMDSLDESQQCSSMMDDVFFIIRKCIRRSVASLSTDGICAVLNTATGCLEGDYCSALKATLRAGYPSGYLDLAYSALQNSIQQGRLQGDSEHARSLFIAHLNNADMSSDCIETLGTLLMQDILASNPHMTTSDKAKLDSCMLGLSGMAMTFRAVVDYGMQQLKSSAIKPRVHPWVDSFLQYSHHFTEDELSSYEAGETFIQMLIVNLDGLLSSFKQCLTPRNYDSLVATLTSDVTARLERAVLKSTFNRFGGLILDKEVRALGTFLTNATSWSVRDKMSRLTQIATLLNLEKVSEVSEYWDTNVAWRITKAELIKILALRTDYRLEDIKHLKL